MISPTLLQLSGDTLLEGLAAEVDDLELLAAATGWLTQGDVVSGITRINELEQVA